MKRIIERDIIKMLDYHSFNPQLHQSYDKINLTNNIRSNLLRKELLDKKNKMRQFSINQPNILKVNDHLNSRYSANNNKSYLKLNKDNTSIEGEQLESDDRQDRLSKMKTNHIKHFSYFKPNNNSQNSSLQFLPQINLPLLPDNISIKKQKTFKDNYVNEDLSHECFDTNMSHHHKLKETKISKSLSTYNLLSSFKKIMIKGKGENTINATSACNHKMYQSSHCGSKKINQDSRIAMSNHFNLDSFDIMAIFDGHGQNGHFLSQLAKNVFMQYFSRSDLFYIPRKFTVSPNLISLKNIMKEEDIYQRIAQQNYKMLREGFSLIEEKINSSEYEKDFSGSTGCAVFVVGNHAICVNIGDSRAILISHQGQTVKTLSNDHKPENQKEKERIIKNGGEVRKSKELMDSYSRIISNRPYRVWVKDKNYPGLAMSRSFGDFVAKEIGVIAEPDIYDYQLTKDDMYIVVASDGIWEWLSNCDVEKEVTPFYSVNDIEGATEALIAKAKEHFTSIGDYIDDITVTILFLNK